MALYRSELITSEVNGITKTIAIHSAAVDTVTFTDASGIKSVTTDANGYATATITYISGQVITFTSSVAKDPDNLSADYKKSVQLLEDTTEIYVMPENTLYWWGYINNLESLTAARWGEGTYVEPTYNTNNIYLNGQCGVGVTNAVSPTVVHGICKTTQKYNDIGIQYFGFTTRYWAEGTSCFSIRQNTLDTIEHIQTSATGQACYPLMRTPSASGTGSSGYIYALWYEVAGEDLGDKADISAIAPNEPNATASKTYAVGEHFYKNGKFCTAITAIASGATFTLNTNYVEGTVADNTDYKYMFDLSTANYYDGTLFDTFNKPFRELMICVKWKYGNTDQEAMWSSAIFPRDILPDTITETFRISVGVNSSANFLISKTQIELQRFLAEAVSLSKAEMQNQIICKIYYR